MVGAFEGNKAETLTMLPTIRSFVDAYDLADVTVVVDAGMISAANQRAIERAGLSFILGARIGEVPYVVDTWRREHPGQDIPDGQVFIQPWPAGPSDHRRTSVTPSTASTVAPVRTDLAQLGHSESSTHRNHCRAVGGVKAPTRGSSNNEAIVPRTRRSGCAAGEDAAVLRRRCRTACVLLGRSSWGRAAGVGVARTAGAGA